MTDDRELSLILDRWLEEGPREMPDRVIDVVASGISRQRQRPAWRLPRRYTLNAYAKMAVAAATVLIVAVIGYSLLPSGSTGVGGPPPSPSPSVTPSPVAATSPSAAASASALLPSWYSADDLSGAGILSAGSHTTRSFTPGFTYSVPDGWVNDSDSADFLSLFPDTPANQTEFSSSGSLARSIHMGPHDSPFFVCAPVENNRGTTAAEMVAAAAANQALAVSGVVDVAIGGMTGKRFDVRANPDWAGLCPGDPPGLDLKDLRTRVFLLDVPGRGVIVTFLGSLHAAGHEAFLAPATQIVESFKFDLARVSPSPS